ncbi:MAG TPA: FliH/SctL family protein [Nocardioides sp.]|nr:FliH/SctL family protein [Nocardioides sp.]
MSSSSSPEPAAARPWRHAERPDLRSGVWTRLGHPSVLGDDVTEQALGRLAERTRVAARAQGYAVGWAEGRQEALVRGEETARAAQQAAEQREAERDAEHQRAVAALQAAAAELRDAVTEVCDLVARQASDLAFEVTRELVGHELSLEEDPGAGVVRRVLATLPAAHVATVRLHPATAESAAAQGLAEQGVTVRPDASLAPDDAVVEVDDAAIDLRIESALDRLRQALR